MFRLRPWQLAGPFRGREQLRSAFPALHVRAGQCGRLGARAECVGSLVWQCLEEIKALELGVPDFWTVDNLSLDVVCGFGGVFPSQNITMIEFAARS